MPINLEIIKNIESSGNPNAYNKKSQAKGHYQITPITLKEWNNYNPKDKHTDKDLYNPEVNKKIADWYMNKRISQMHKAYKIQDTLENRLTSYNAGIGNTRKGRVPTETQKYIKKYKSLETKMSNLKVKK